MKKENIDWLMIQKRMSETIDENYIKEPMSNIMIHYIYINNNNSIEKIISEKENLSLEDDFSILPGNRSIQLIQNHNMNNKKKFKLSESLLYNVDVDSDNIQNYVNYINSVDFLTVLPFFNVIKILPSLFIFHSLNCIFMIYKEINERCNQTKRLLIRKDIRQTQKKHSLRINDDDDDDDGDDDGEIEFTKLN